MATVNALIVDDSPLARRIIRHHLTKFGFRIVGEAENPAQALKMFADLKPDVVTLDVMMPAVEGTDSLGVLREIKKQAYETAVVVVSILPFEKTRETFLKEGALAYVIKPFNQFSFEPVRQKLVRIFPNLAASA
jgi:two-component system, chemotaxis family, chemotaxis protein CheY